MRIGKHNFLVVEDLSLLKYCSMRHSKNQCGVPSIYPGGVAILFGNLMTIKGHIYSLVVKMLTLLCFIDPTKRLLCLYICVTLFQGSTKFTLFTRANGTVEGVITFSGGTRIFIWGVQTQMSNWVLGTNPGFSCGFWVKMQDFYVNFRSRARIFIMVLEVDRGPTGAIAPTCMYVGLPLITIATCKLWVQDMLKKNPQSILV